MCGCLPQGACRTTQYPMVTSALKGLVHTRSGPDLEQTSSLPSGSSTSHFPHQVLSEPADSTTSWGGGAPAFLPGAASGCVLPAVIRYPLSSLADFPGKSLRDCELGLQQTDCQSLEHFPRKHPSPGSPNVPVIKSVALRPTQPACSICQSNDPSLASTLQQECVGTSTGLWRGGGGEALLTLQLCS